MTFGITRIFDLGDLIPNNPIHLIWGYFIGELINRVLIPKIKQSWSPRTKLYFIAYAGMLPGMLLPMLGIYVFYKFAVFDYYGLLLKPLSFELQLGFALWIVCGFGLLYATARFIGIMHKKDKKFVPLIELAYD